MISSPSKPGFSSPKALEFLENLSPDTVNCLAPSSALEWLSPSDPLKLGSEIHSLGHCICLLITKVHSMSPCQIFCFSFLYHFLLLLATISCYCLHCCYCINSTTECHWDWEWASLTPLFVCFSTFFAF